MESKEYHLQTLSQMGLTQNQAKLYLSLLLLGKSSAATLTKQTGLARQEVYRVLQELYDDGLVAKTIDNPTLFQAVPLKEVIAMLTAKKAKQFEQTQQRLERLIIDCPTEKQTDVVEYKIQLIPQKKLLISHQEKMLRSAKETIQIISNARRFSQGVNYYFNLYEQSLRNNVKLDVIVMIGEEAKNVTEKLKRLEIYPNFSIRFTTEPKASLLIVDRTEALLTLHPKDNFGKSPLLCTNQPELLSIYQEYFEATWKKSAVIPIEI